MNKNERVHINFAQVAQNTLCEKRMPGSLSFQCCHDAQRELLQSLLRNPRITIISNISIYICFILKFIRALLILFYFFILYYISDRSILFSPMHSVPHFPTHSEYIFIFFSYMRTKF